MKFKKVNVVFICDGIADKPEVCALIGERVLTCSNGEFGLYNAYYEKNTDMYFVDLDGGNKDFLAGNPTLLIDLITG